jgi:hypothetical protein
MYKFFSWTISVEIEKVDIELNIRRELYLAGN